MCVLCVHSCAFQMKCVGEGCNAIIVTKKNRHHRCNACMIIYNQQHSSKSKPSSPTVNKKRKEHPSKSKSESPSKKLKPYHELRKTQRSVRRKAGMTFLQQHDIPISELQPTITSHQVIHLPTTIRQQMRSVKGIRMPSEKVMIALKHELSVTHGTATATATAIQGDWIAHPRPILSTMLEYSAFRPALLIIYYTQILPTPLHVFLGIGNRIIDQVLPKLVDPVKLAAAKQSVKSVYSYGLGGVTNVHELNGPELAKFVKEEWDFIQDEKAVKLLQWMRSLHQHLLHKRQLTDEELNQFRLVVNEIQTQWKTVTGQKPFPKLHMLTHCVEFASIHRYLGKYSEAQIESCHSIINHAIKHSHHNQGKQLGEKLRRSLADISLRAIKLVLSPKK